MNPYGETIQEHFKHPRHYGSLEAPDIRHEDVNPFCGDRVRVEVSLADEAVRDARFQGDLCMIAKAAASVLMEMVGGQSLDRLKEFPDDRLLDALGAPIQPARRRCALLPLEVLRAGVNAYCAARIRA